MEEKLLNIIRIKLDRLMENFDPEEGIEPGCISREGSYTVRKRSFYYPGWTYSFYLGMIALMYIHTKEERYIDYLKRAKGVYTYFLYENKEEIGHDTGFLYSLYAVAMYKLTGDTDYERLALKAADEIGKRYRFAPRHMQAFYDLRIRGISDEISLMIVDDMMNMCLLMWAYKRTGHSFYRDVYENHIETAVNYLIRSDYSVAHAYHFDVKTGNPLTEMNYCGFGIGTHWARGTSWMIYGLTKALEFTGMNEKYLYPLEGVTRKYLEGLEGSAIPVWDFRLPEYAEFKTDSSAAVITASAFMDFENLNLTEDLKSYLKNLTDRVIEAVSSPEYLGKDSDEFIIRYQDNEGCLWGDYFLTELLMKRLYGNELTDFWI